MYSQMATSRKNDAEYSVQSLRQSKMDLARDSVSFGNTNKVFAADKKLTMASLQNQFIAKYMEAWQESLDKKKNKDIEKQFNTFA